MSTQAAAQLMEWHMHQARQYCGPTSIPPNIKQEYIPNDFVDFYPQQNSGFDIYQAQAYEAAFAASPFMQLQRSHTLSDMSDFDQSDYSSSPPPPLGYFDENIDDMGSVYSETPSSMVSNDYMGQQIDASSWVMPELPHRLSSVSVNSVSSSRERRDAPTSAPQTSSSDVDALMQTLAGPVSPGSEDDNQQTAHGKAKNHCCPIPDCNKSFSQPTHLKIHMRSHTGEKPYVCAIPGCGARFSQLGNRRTHEDRHLGKKPSRRSRAVSDPSELNGTKRYYCKLDGCLQSDGGRGKEFTQLGNLKAHQNKFHKDTLLRLSAHFSQHNSLEYERSLSREEQELISYFKSLYRNCNKGIKGRGKGRRVEVVV